MSQAQGSAQTGPSRPKSPLRPERRGRSLLLKEALAGTMFQAEGKHVQRPWGRKELGTCLEAGAAGSGGARGTWRAGRVGPSRGSWPFFLGPGRQREAAPGAAPQGFRAQTVL